MDAITIGGASVHLDFLLRTDLKQVGIVSYYDRSLSLVKSFAAVFRLFPNFVITMTHCFWMENLKHSYSQCLMEKRSFITPSALAKTVV